MKPNEFLTELQSFLGGTIDSEDMVLGSTPRLNAHYRGYFVKVDFVVASELRIDINTRPPHRLRVRKEGFISRALGAFGLICDHKTGDALFDEKYVIDNASPEWAAKVLCQDIRTLLTDLEPFSFFELTNKDYRCLKSVHIPEYEPSRAAKDVDTMIQIVELTQRIDSAGG